LPIDENQVEQRFFINSLIQGIWYGLGLQKIIAVRVRRNVSDLNSGGSAPPFTLKGEDTI